MNKLKDLPFTISIFLLAIWVIEIYYFLFDFLTSGLFIHYGNSLGNLSVIHILALLFMYAVLITSLIIITYGFFEKEKCTRFFTLLLLGWSSVWTIWGIIVGNAVIKNFVFLAIFIAMAAYLFSSYVKEYFIEAFRHGEYTLYKRMVTLSSGRTLPIFFFSKHKPKSGRPTVKPEGYKVGVNERSNMPYLKKIR